MGELTVRRVDFGYFVRPGEETGTGRARVEPCLGYLVGHPDGLVLLDTGMGSDPDVDAHYRKVKSTGARIVEQLNQTIYGEHQYGVVDLDGHHWLFSQHAKDLSPDSWGAKIADKK